MEEISQPLDRQEGEEQVLIEIPILRVPKTLDFEHFVTQQESFGGLQTFLLDLSIYLKRNGAVPDNVKKML